MAFGAAAQAKRPIRMPVVEPAPDPLKGDTTAHAPRPRIAMGTFDGLVTDTMLAPIANAEVTVLRTSVKVRTGSNGRFRITSMLAGQYLIIVRRIGYQPTSGGVQVPPDDTLRLSYALTRAPQKLDTVRLVTQRRSFRMMEVEDQR